MTRVHIICEGQTEETFVNEMLAPHLARLEVYPTASLVGRPGKKGGAVTTHRMISDIKLRLKGDPNAYCTTFFDFYGLDAGFPGKDNADSLNDFGEKARKVETELLNAVRKAVGDDALRHFIPYVQMYEFEGLLFSDPEKLARGLGEAGLEPDFKMIRSEFRSPEEINDSRITAPSKRLLKLMPRYDKPLHGSLAALEIGLDTIREECCRFNEWLIGLEGLAETIQ
ncbi:MAG: DUF4276 family protein [Verrucomicrobia bacterium]|nr:DUF4276 family protein [Verrucomicrobiota bacterium]